MHEFPDAGRCCRGVARSFVLLLLIGLAQPSVGSPPDPSFETRIARFEGIVQRLMRDLKTPSLSAIILKDQQVVWEKAWGYADVENKIKATLDTPYGLASVTKALASVVFFRNVEKGLISLEDRASKYDAFAYRHKYPNADDIKLKHVMSHTTLDPVGTIWRYDGDRYDVLGKAIKRASGRSFREQFMNDIAGPLGMTRTAPNPVDPELQDRFRSYLGSQGKKLNIRDKDGKRRRLINGYDFRNRYWGNTYNTFITMVGRALETTDYGRGLYISRSAMPADDASQEEFNRFWLNEPEQKVYRKLARAYHYDEQLNISRSDYPVYFGAGAGFNSTVRDLAKFDIALDQGRLISRATKAMAWEPVRSPTGEVFPYGYGWFSAEHAGRKIIWHGGAWRGMSCMYLKVPEENYTFIFLSNSKVQSDAFDTARGDSLNSGFGLAFLRLFIYEPMFGEVGPDVDWTSPAEKIIEQIERVQDPRLKYLYRREAQLTQGMYMFMQRTDVLARLFNDIRPHFTEPFVDPYAKLPVIAHLTDVGNDQRLSVDFSLDKATDVRIYAVGEGTDDGVFDYGWIENAKGEQVWSMVRSESLHAGGAQKNRLVNQIMNLSAGKYTLHYVTDDSHAYMTWNATPPDHLFWGIRLLKEVTSPNSAGASNRVPGERWMRYATPEEAGFDAAKLEKARRFAERIGSAAVMVVYRGAILVDWGDTDRRYRSHSSRKSLMSALYGVHIGLGTIDPKKTLAELGIDEVNNPLTDTEKTATIYDLLSARSGIYLPAAYEPATNPKPERGAYKPGEHFCYNNWDFNALTTIFEQETDTKIFEEFQDRIAEPIGMQDYDPSHGYYHFDLEKSMHPAYPFRMSARDYARFGLLYLNNGRWGDKQILSEAYVKKSQSRLSQAGWTGGYGLMWWLHDEEPFKSLGMFSAYGNYCQAIDVIPGADMVFVNRVDSYTDDLITITWQEHKELIRMILDAKSGAPKPDPKLVPIPNPHSPYVTVAISPAQQQKYVGEYPTIYETPVRVFTDGGRLMINMGEGDVPLDYLGQNHFIMRDFREHVYFEPRADGESWEMVSMWGLIVAAQKAMDRHDADEANVILEKLRTYFPACETGHRLRSKLRMWEAGVKLRAAIEEFSAITKRRPQITLETSPIAWGVATQWAKLNPINLPESVLRRYVGTYGVHHITMEGGELYYARQGQARSRLRPMAWNLFSYDQTGGFRFKFECDKTGNVTGLKIIKRDRIHDLALRRNSTNAE